MEFSRRAFLEGAVAAALVAAATGEASNPTASAGGMYSRLEVAGWLSNYKLRCQSMARLLEATAKEQVDTQTVAATREWLMRWTEFEEARDKWLAARMAIGSAKGEGYEWGRADRSPQSQPAGDLGLAWFDGYWLGFDDAHRRRSA